MLDAGTLLVGLNLIPLNVVVGKEVTGLLFSVLTGEHSGGDNGNEEEEVTDEKESEEEEGAVLAVVLLSWVVME
jgi:hypothetical protein